MTDVLQWMDVLEPFIIGLIVVLGGGQIYLWLRVMSITTSVAVLQSEHEATEHTLEQIDENVREIVKCIGTVNARLARMEGRMMAGDPGK